MSYQNPVLRLLPFWLFILVAKAGNAVYFAALPVIGEKIFPVWIVGIIISAASFIQLPFDLISGAILDRYGYIKILRISAIAFAAAGFSFILGITPTAYILSVSFSVFAWLFFGPGVNAYILSGAEKSGAERYIIARDAFQSAGTILGAAAIPFAIALKSSFLGIIIAAIFLASFVFSLFVPREKTRVLEERKLPTHGYYIRRNYWKDLYGALNHLNPASWMLLFQGFSSSIFYAAVWFAVPLSIADKTKNIPAISLGIFDAAIIVLGFAFGYLAGRFHKKTLIIAGLLLFGATAALLGFYEGLFFLLFGFLATMGDELSSISLWTWLTHLDKDHSEDGAVAGVITFFQDLGWAIGPLIAGFFYKPLGIGPTISLSAAPIFIVLIFALLKTRGVPRIHHLPIHARKPHRLRHKH